MNKPASMMIQEFKNGLVQLINNSGLPAYILELVIGEYYTNLKNLSEAQTQQEIQQYKRESEQQKEVITDEGQK